MSERLPGNLIRADVGCACHSEKAKSHADLGMAFECHGAFQLVFPVRVFEPLAELEYRQMRQGFVRDSLELFDEFYERARKNLLEHDPLVIRPQRKGRALTLVDSQDLATEGNGEDGTSEGGPGWPPLKEC